jgi:hypothetical protein
MCQGFGLGQQAWLFDLHSKSVSPILLHGQTGTKMREANPSLKYSGQVIGVYQHRNCSRDILELDRPILVCKKYLFFDEFELFFKEKVLILKKLKGILS